MASPYKFGQVGGLYICNYLSEIKGNVLSVGNIHTMGELVKYMKRHVSIFVFVSATPTCLVKLYTCNSSLFKSFIAEPLDCNDSLEFL